MKYNATLPASALIAILLISLLVHFNVIPPGQEILDYLKEYMNDGFFIIIFLIILLEAIVYVGFYFPGQFFAVVLVISSKPTSSDILYLTLSMVAAATLGSLINYGLGAISAKNKEQKQSTKFKHLLVAMIHINSLAFFMFAQGQNHKPLKVVALAGILNMPYYLLLIAGTAVLSEEIMAVAENNYMLIGVISLWLIVALILDVKQRKITSE